MKFLNVAFAVAAALLVAPSASAQNLLTNGGFETPVATPGGEVNVSNTTFGQWSSYNNNFIINQTPPLTGNDPISGVGAHGGNQALKNFGDAGVFADFAANPGDEFEGSVWAINPNNNDQLAGGQIGLAVLIWQDINGGVIGDVPTDNVITSVSATNEWNLLSIPSSIAPAGTATVRFQVFTTDTGAGGGAPRFDDAYFASSVAIPEPSSLALLGIGAVGFVARRRRRS